jgi:hypothetical protein
MLKLDSIAFRTVFSLLLIVGLFYMPAPAFSQDEANIQNLVLNGGFEEGFQDFGVGYGWGAFSNGNAVVGWNADTWDDVVAAGQNAQLIEIRENSEMNRYAGIYQTVPVVPGKQYKLSLQGVIRSTEGDIDVSDYGYRLQYGLDYNGDTAWELIGDEAWVEIPWDEQPLTDSSEENYRLETFETTVTAKTDQLTLFIRGWKKWVNNGTGIFDLDEISLVGPAPKNFELPVAQAAVVSNPAPSAETTTEEVEPAAPTSGEESQSPSEELAVETAPQSELSAEVEAVPQASQSQLPISGQGRDETLIYIVVSGLLLLLVLLIGAITATMRQRQSLE